MISEILVNDHVRNNVYQIYPRITSYSPVLLYGVTSKSAETNDGNKSPSVFATQKRKRRSTACEHCSCCYISRVGHRGVVYDLLPYSKRTCDTDPGREMIAAGKADFGYSKVADRVQSLVAM